MKEDEDNDYLKIEKGEKVKCYHEGCKGYLRRVKNLGNDKKYWGFISSQNSLICRCSINCRHIWVVLKSNLSKRIVYFELGKI